MSMKKIKAVPAKGGSETPAVPAPAKNEITEADSLGRLITLRKPTPFQKFELARIIGNDSTNQAYYGQCFILLHVAKIDDDDCFFETQAELKALVNRLGDEGIDKATMMFALNFAGASLNINKDVVKK